jgi:hypothetical protein
MRAILVVMFFFAFVTTLKAQVSSVTGQYLQDNNILLNPGFESGIGKWVNSVGTFTADYTNFVQGKASGKVVLSSQTLGFTQDSTSFVTALSDGVQGLASVYIKSNFAAKVCSRSAGVTSSTNCVDVIANNKWALYKVPVILGSTSNGISIATSGAVTGTIYFDESFVGIVDITANVDDSKIAGEAYFAGTVNCQWSRTSTTVGSFPADTDCPGPTIVYQNMGQWQTTDSDLPRVTVNNLPAGTYKATFTFMNNVTSGNPALSITDGTTTCEPVPGNGSTTSNALNTVSCSFQYVSSGNRSFEIVTGATAGAVVVANSVTTPRSGTKFQLEYFGSSSVYTSTNADTDWASCGLTGSAFTGFGTSVPTPSLHCKREGGDLLIKGTFTAGTTPTAVEARMALPTWNGVQLTSAGSQIIPSIQAVGVGGRNDASVGHGILIEPSVSYVTFSQYADSVRFFLTKQNGNIIASTGTIHSFNARIPINGWQNSNIIIGQFNGLERCLTTLECSDSFSAKVSSSGVVSGESIDWLNGNCSVATTSAYTCTFNTSLFTVTPNCQLTPDINSASGFLGQIEASSSSTITARLKTDSGGNIASAFILSCQKQGVDYIGKTAKAVSSDQNVKSVGLTGAVVNSCEWTSAGAFNNSTMCNAGFTAISKPATGRYQLTFRNTQKNNPVCTANNLQVGADRMCNIFSVSTTAVTMQCENSSTGADLDVPGFVICHGVE